LEIQMNWTPGRIGGLTTQEVKNLYENATVRGGVEIAEMCRLELEARKTKSKPKFQLPEGFSKIARTSISRKLEGEADDLLVALANELLLKYDLTAKRAKELSEGTKGFKVHELLNEKGVSKIGAVQKAGLVAFDRFISYRLKDEAYALLCLLTDSNTSTGTQHQVFGPSRLLDRFVPLDELRPYPLNQISIGIYTGGESFDTFQEAANRYRWLIDQVAPKR
jgi:hypothetical protein